MCAALPFGLSSAPRIFTKVMRQFVAHLRQHMVRVLPYLDDFLFITQSQTKAAALSEVIDQLLQSLGLQRNTSKGYWTPTQSLTHLGMQITTNPPSITVTAATRGRISRFSQDILHLATRRQRMVPRTMLQRFTGLVISQWLAVPIARGHTRALYDALARSHSNKCRLHTAALTELRFWASDAWAHCAPLRPIRPTWCVETDASGQAWE